MPDTDWQAAYRDILRILESNRALLTDSDIEHVNHYIAVDEPEMALEILCLELMRKPGTPLSDLEELGALAKQFGLDQESVYDSEFWAHFTAALDARRQRG